MLLFQFVFFLWQYCLWQPIMSSIFTRWKKKILDISLSPEGAKKRILSTFSEGVLITHPPANLCRFLRGMFEELCCMRYEKASVFTLYILFKHSKVNAAFFDLVL